MAVSMAIMSCSEDGHGTGSLIIGFSAMIVAFSFIYVGIKNYRDKLNGGVVTFAKAFLLGLFISLIASTLYVLTWAVEFHFFMPDFMDKYSAMQVKQLKESAMLSGPALDDAIKNVEATSYRYKRNPFFFAMYTYIEILPLGIIITLISALILKRKAPVTNLQ